jgi:hypothetical protein
MLQQAFFMEKCRYCIKQVYAPCALIYGNHIHNYENKQQYEWQQN